MTEKAPDAIIVFITVASTEEASRIAQLLVEKKLAACVQILPEMQSVYCWKGEIEQQPEILILAKTVKSKFSELETQVRAVHSYETPEIVATPITNGSTPYLEWLSASVGSSRRSEL
jgi:periplasmic divalent cation tolerance protein